MKPDTEAKNYCKKCNKNAPCIAVAWNSIGEINEDKSQTFTKIMVKTYKCECGDKFVEEIPFTPEVRK